MMSIYREQKGWLVMACMLVRLVRLISEQKPSVELFNQPVEWDDIQLFYS